MRVASWNVNSIGKRLPRLLQWLAARQPDVVCLQETKAQDDNFPAADCERAGYHVAYWGEKAYNGVAILSRSALTSVRRGLDVEPREQPEQTRWISAEVEGLTVACAYIPNGRQVGSDAYAFKLAWLARLGRILARDYHPSEPLVVAGDFNVAPRDCDVAFPDRWQRTVLCHPEVRGAFQRLLAWGLVDSFAHLRPAGGEYSWWDYRMLGFPKGNGLRIDLLLATAGVAARLRAVGIDRDERKGTLPSDHVPVWMDVD